VTQQLKDFQQPAEIFQSEGFPNPNNPNPQGLRSFGPFMIIPDFNTLSVYEFDRNPGIPRIDKHNQKPSYAFKL